MMGSNLGEQEAKWDHAHLEVGPIGERSALATDSAGRRNTDVKSFCWGFQLQGLTWSFV